MHLLPQVDYIYALDHGRIAAHGTYADLMKSGYQLVKHYHHHHHGGENEVQAAAEGGKKKRKDSMRCDDEKKDVAVTVAASADHNDDNSSSSSSSDSENEDDEAKKDRASPSTPVSAITIADASKGNTKKSETEAAEAEARLAAGKKLVQDEERATGMMFDEFQLQVLASFPS